MGRRLKIAIHHDGDVESPCENDGFKLYSFHRDHISHCDPDKLPHSEAKLKGLLAADRAWLLDYYEHGLCHWSLSGEGMQCQWDTSRNSGILVWEEPANHLSTDPEQRRKSAASFLETYTMWCNGECYWYSIKTETDEYVDTCGGFIGMDHLVDGLNEILEADDDIVLVKSRDFDYSWVRTKLKGHVRKESYFPTQPQPEYFI
jgi:hypothetical protein